MPFHQLKGFPLMLTQFEKMLTAELPLLRGYAVMLTRNPSDADDLMQSVAVRVIRAETTFEVGTNFGAWVRKIMRNVFLDNCRRGRRSTVSLDDVGEDVLSAPERVTNHIMGQQALRAMYQLNPSQRRSFAMICGLGLTHKEAATALSCSIGIVKSRVWRARANLSAMLGAEMAIA